MSSDPTQSPHGVWLPMPLFQAMMDAYYGVGPLHPKAVGYIPKPSTPPPEPKEGGGPTNLDGVRLSTSPPRHWKPGPFAQRASQSTPPPKETPLAEPAPKSQPPV